MDKIIKYVQNYLMYGLAFPLFGFAIEMVPPNESSIKIMSMIPNIVWHVIGFGFISWFVLLFVFLMGIVAFPKVRERTLRRLANLKERDEREQYITGQASRSAYMSTLGLMLFLLFLSTFNINVYKIQEPMSEYRYNVSTDFHFSFFNKNEAPPKIPQDAIIFTSQNIALSSTTMMLILIGWQLLAFNLTARKEQKTDVDY